MTRYTFGSRKLCKCLGKLGFEPRRQGGSSHLKYSIPKGHKAQKGIRPFIIVILGKKRYDPHTCSNYIRQISALGFDKKNFIKYL